MDGLREVEERVEGGVGELVRGVEEVEVWGEGD